MIERPQYYVFTLDDDDVDGFRAINFQIELDSDAPFRLSAIAFLNYENTLSTVSFRYTRPDRSWTQRNLVPMTGLNPYVQSVNGAAGTAAYPPPFLLGSPVHPNSLYPPGAAIVMDFTELAGTHTGITKVIFIGTKIFQDGAVWAPTYPNKFAAMPFLDYQLSLLPPAFGAAPLLDVPFDIQPDADFVWQAGQHTSGDASLSGGIGVKIKDYRGKYYMNDYTPVEVIYGFDNAQTPGLVYPEIYIPKNQALYFDCVTLTGVTPAVAQLFLSHKGVKIYG